MPLLAPPPLMGVHGRDTSTALRRCLPCRYRPKKKEKYSTRLKNGWKKYASAREYERSKNCEKKIAFSCENRVGRENTGRFPFPHFYSVRCDDRCTPP